MSQSRRRTGRRSERGGRGVRLHKVLAAAGVASRRAAEELIRAGRVKVNGTVITRLGSLADPARDKIEVDGRPVGRPRRARYYLLYKPRGVVTTTRDPHARHTVSELVPDGERLYPVGRLDAASEGLLLLTNDGASTHALLHPSFGVPRTYRVSVDGSPTNETLRRLAEGIELDGRRTAPCQVAVLRRDAEHCVLEFELGEGRRRQIRRMLKAVGHPVRRLVRTHFGPLALGGLEPGEYRPLEAAEVKALRALVAQAERLSKKQHRP